MRITRKYERKFCMCSKLEIKNYEHCDIVWNFEGLFDICRVLRLNRGGNHTQKQSLN
jgi:hypothetical protein